MGAIGRSRFRRQRIRLACLILLAALCALALPYVRYGVRGLWRGETFYRGLPVSYWREAIRTGETLPVYLEEPVRERLARIWRSCVRPALITGRLAVLPVQPYASRGPQDVDRGALPALAALLEDSDLRIQTRAALLVGDSYGLVVAWEKWARDSQRDRQLLATAVERLRSHLDSPHATVRGAAAEALTRFAFMREDYVERTHYRGVLVPKAFAPVGNLSGGRSALPAPGPSR